MSITKAEEVYEEERLKRVLDEIRAQLGEKRDSTEKFKKDAISTRKFMWEEVEGAPNNLKELDQLVQAKQYLDELKRQEQRSEFYSRQVKKLEKMLISPYFGRIDFLEEGESNEEKIYIGISNLADDKKSEYLVYDWRAPISSMFYDFEIGGAEYRCPAGIIKGEVLLKRQYRISKGHMDYMFESSLKIDDEILQEILGKSADSRMKTIITTIQREQNRIIRDEKHKLLIVQGPAGSGKTSIALHRIAYILYRYRDSIGPENIVIFSPNQIFNDYISAVLPELGEENMYQTTFMEYAKESFKHLVLEDMNEQMEYLMTSREKDGYKERIKSISYKTSEDFMRVLRNYVSYLENEGFEFSDIVYKDNVIISGMEMNQLLKSDYSYLPLLKRLEKIRQRVLSFFPPYEKKRVEEVRYDLAESGEYVNENEIKSRSILLVREEFRPLKEKLEEMTRLDIFEAYSGLFEDLNLFKRLSGGELPEGFGEISHLTISELSFGRLMYEDIAPLLYLRGALGGISSNRSIRHVIIDEVQDYTLLHFEIFKQLFPDSNMTLLGDLNQSINPYVNIRKYENVENLFGVNSALINLNRSFRSTREITVFCRAMLLDKEEAGYIDRQGEKPQLISVPENEWYYKEVVKAINILVNKGYKSIALICKTAQESIRLYNSIHDKAHMKLVSKDDEEYIRGVVVIPSYLAKGLEFDAVLVCKGGHQEYYQEEDRRLLYTACTRALHELHIYYSNTVSPFIQQIDKNLYQTLANE